MSTETRPTEPRLRFRINMLLAERDMTLKELFDRIKALGSTISSTHFYRQMKPYHSPIRLDLLALVVRALNVDPAQLFELVEGEASQIQPPPSEGSGLPKPGHPEPDESEKVKAARASARIKRDLALLGGKISVLPTAKPK